MVTGDITGRDVINGSGHQKGVSHGLLAESGDGSNGRLCKNIGFNELINY